jgi:hypothetical protein
LAIFDNGTLLAKDARISGNIIARSGYIGSKEYGWEIDEQGLNYGEAGTSDSFILKPSGISIGDSEESWAMFVGENFGVTTNGEIHATAGRIGNMTIGDINDKIVGNNLLSQGSKEEQVGGRDGHKPEFLKTTFDLTPIFEKYGLIEYTLSFDCKSEVEGEIQVYCQTDSGSKYTFSENIQVTTDYKRYEITFTPKLGSKLDPTNLEASYLAFYGTYDSGRVPHVKMLKLEKGTVATDWCPGSEDSV